MNEHHKEPWKIDPIDRGGFIRCVINSSRPSFVADDVTEANARRIVACVNACAGFDTELLELAASGTAPSLIEIFREHGDLWKQRDDLLEAFKALMSMNEDEAMGNEISPQRVEDVLNAAAQVIASAEGA